MNQINPNPNNCAAATSGDPKVTRGSEGRICIRIISSMAPRLIVEELAKSFSEVTGLCVEFTSMGGVDAVREVQESNTFDVTVLSKDSIKQLVTSGHLHPDSVDLVVSEVAVAVRSDQPHPDLSSEQAARESVLSADSISYSTGPSGRALEALFEKWGITKEIRKRLICPPPGTPVGSLVASGEAELGFQQRSELIHVQGIDLVGPLPADIQIVTTFSAGICSDAKNLTEIKQLLEFMHSPQADDAKQRQGMQPA